MGPTSKLFTQTPTCFMHTHTHTLSHTHTYICTLKYILKHCALSDITAWQPKPKYVTFLTVKESKSGGVMRKQMEQMVKRGRWGSPQVSTCTVCALSQLREGTRAWKWVWKNRDDVRQIWVWAQLEGTSCLALCADWETAEKSHCLPEICPSLTLAVSRLRWREVSANTQQIYFSAPDVSQTNIIIWKKLLPASLD